VIGTHDGSPREVYLYQSTDAEATWRRFGLGAVAWQTGFNPVIAMELLSTGAWTGAGVLGPEAMDPDPYLALLDSYGIHHAMIEMESGRHRPT
jgi:saccharopine dehydrogenase-like NADP-dependent oxidoreductase